jgi:hypothetical protein
MFLIQGGAANKDHLLKSLHQMCVCINKEQEKAGVWSRDLTKLLPHNVDYHTGAYVRSRQVYSAR